MKLKLQCDIKEELFHPINYCCFLCIIWGRWDKQDLMLLIIKLTGFILKTSTYCKSVALFSRQMTWILLSILCINFDVLSNFSLSWSDSKLLTNLIYSGNKRKLTWSYESWWVIDWLFVSTEKSAIFLQITCIANYSVFVLTCMVKMLPILILIYGPSQKWEVGWRKQSSVIWSNWNQKWLIRCPYGYISCFGEKDSMVL